MGGSNTKSLITPEADNFYSRFIYVRNKGPINFYIENISSKEYATKTIVCDTQEQINNFFNLINKYSELYHENIINVEKIYCLESGSCGTTAEKYLMLFQYPFRSIKDERQERSVLRDGFTEPQIWSIILSVCRGLYFLQQKGIPYSPLTANQILIDKQGSILIDGNHLVDNSILEDNYVSRSKNLRYLPHEFKNSKSNYLSIRQVQKCNMYSIGIIALQCIQVRDIVELEDSYDGRQKQIIQLLINRSTHVSIQLRQIIRRLTQSSENRPTYQQIIQFIQNQEAASSVLYLQQNQIPTAKKNSINIDQGSLNFDGFGGRPSSNLRLNMQRSSTVHNAPNYSIPSFSYNNINQGVKGGQLKQASDPVESIVTQRISRTNIPQPTQLFPIPHRSHVLSFPVNSPSLQMTSTQKFSIPKQEFHIQAYPIQQINPNLNKQVVSHNLNFNKSPFSGLKLSGLQSQSIIKQVESDISQVDSNFKQKISPSPGIRLADEIKLITPKPSLLSRESNFQTPRVISKKNNFSKTGSIEGTNKIYNDNPVLCYEKLDFSDMNNMGAAWLYFQGNFKDGKRVGPGTLYLSNGQKFEGNYINDNAQGRGKYSTLDWKQVEGIWKNGRLISIL